MVTSAFQLYSFYELYKAKGEISEIIIPLPGGAQAPNKRWMVTTCPAILQALEDHCIVSDRVKLFTGKVWLALGHQSPETATELIARFKPVLENMLVSLDSNRTKELRRLHIAAFNALFTPEYSSRLRDLLAEEARRLIYEAQTQGGGQIDIVKDYARPLISFLNLKILGIDQSRKQELEENLAKVSAMLPGLLGFEVGSIKEGQEGSEGLQNLFMQTIEEHQKTQTADDLIGVFLSMGGLEPMEFVGMCTLVVRATEGPANLIGNGTLALLLHPQEMQKLRDDPQLIGGAVEELLRYTPPAEFIPRVAKCATRIAGKKIEAGDVLLLNIGVANRCNDHIANPEQLNIKRKNTLVFGYGWHECLGQSLAHLVGEVAIGTLLEQTGSLRLVSPETLKWVQEMGNPNGLRGLEALPVEISPGDSGPANGPGVYQVAS